MGVLAVPGFGGRSVMRERVGMEMSVIAGRGGGANSGWIKVNELWMVFMLFI